MKTKPSNKEIERHYKEVKDLIDGVLVEIPYNALGVTILAKIEWLEDNYPTVSAVRLVALSFSRRALVEACLFTNTHYDKLLKTKNKQVLDAVIKCSVFKSFDKRIKAVCKEGDAWEKKYEDFVWDSDILTRYYKQRGD